VRTGEGELPDLSNPDTFSGGPPHTLFVRLRREAPVCWNVMADGAGFWSITRAADIAAVSRENDRFSSWLGGTMIRDDAVMPVEIWRQAMINMDPPQHTKFRDLVSQVFTPRRVAEQAPQIRRTLRGLLDELGDLREFDLVERIAVPLPLMVIADVLGVPRADHYLLFDWNARIAGFDDARLRRTPDDGLRALAELIGYLSEWISHPGKHAQRGLVGDLLNAELDGRRLLVPEIAGLFSLLMVAGNETTRHTYSGGMAALLEHPEQARVLLRQPEHIPNAVEEMLRWVSAVLHFRRTATCDTELGGVPIAAGEKVVLWYVSANRDEAVFDAPHTFDVTRPRNRHQAFGGGGRHFCLGAVLAKLELEIMLEETLVRFPSLELASAPLRFRSALFNALAALPVACR
jgi:cholest-4-en-3-one 26-monooxygenase